MKYTTWRNKEKMIILTQNAGNFAIEAAIIIPLTLFLILAMISLSFSLYNRCSLERAAVVSALRGSEEIFSDNAIRFDTVSKAINEVLNYNLLSEQEINKNIEIKGNQIVVVLETQEKGNTFTTCSNKKAINPVFWIRSFRKLKGVVQTNDAGGI
ncbi:MAG: pilus assembly protein [Lachnospiraceae bacterium]|nr:pilus assembly protein [Lachnospiraceae bacterium]